MLHQVYKESMTWDETIKYIRTIPDLKKLVEEAYLEEDLTLNCERFKNSEEYHQTIAIINQYAPRAQSILDIGSGNGISAISFALDGYTVTVLEPDPSEDVGAGAIRKLKNHFGIKHLEIYEQFAEDINFSNDLFDIVYIRQAMHHANNLKKFITECARVLKPGGLLLTIRDHVIFNECEKQFFLSIHPLQKFYAGENAFSPAEYRSAMTGAGLIIIRELQYYDSVINYFPLPKSRLRVDMKVNLQNKIGLLARFPFIFDLYKWKNRSSLLPDERAVVGRMYSYIAQKKK